MLQFKSIRSVFLTWFLVIATLPLLVFGVILYYQRSSALKQEAFAKLTAICDLKVERLNVWFQEREGDLRVIAQHPDIRQFMAQIFMPVAPEATRISPDQVRAAFQEYLRDYAAYIEIFLLHPVSGHVLISTDPSHEGWNESDNSYFSEPLQSRGLIIKDIYRSAVTGKPSMTFSAPIFARENSTEMTGVVVTRVDLDNTIYAILSNRTGMGETGETLIVNKDVVALNELRWHQNAPLHLHITARPAMLAAQGGTGVVETQDYRGERVLAAYTYLPRMQWGLVAKQDLRELYQPITALLQQMLLIGGATLALVAVLAMIVAQSITRPIRTLRAASEQIAAGDLSTRFVHTSRDELSHLAQTLNAMTATVEAQVTAQQANTAFARLLNTLADAGQFQQQLLPYVMECTGSQVGVFHASDAKHTAFIPIFSIGAEQERLKPFPMASYDGELGHALRQRQIVHLSAIPADTIFTFRTTTGTAIPKSLLTIPILVEENVVAIISLASLTGYTPAQIALIEQNWLSLNTKFATLHANETVKTLAHELQAQNQELQMQAQELQQQSESLRQKNIEMEVQSRQIVEANRLKSAFLSNMSHELRTPLNSVIALSRVLMLQAKTTLTDEEFNYLEIIARNGKHLLQLINDILDISKIEAGKMTVSVQPFALRNLVDAVIESLEPLAQEKGLRLSVNAPATFPTITSDDAKVRQILQNMIGNAVKFTEQGDVEISVRREESRVGIVVRDTGIGIPSDALPFIFEEFRQVDGSTSRRYEGTGLGLSIALRYAKLLGGDIHVESQVGRGSTFTLWLPVQPRDQSTRAPAVKDAGPLQPALPKILVVDDDPQVTELLRHYLSADGYEVLTAHSGSAALELARQHQPLAITLDILMADMDGWETLQRLKADPQTASIPVIMLSVADDRATASALGAVGYILKPVDKERLIAEIRNVAGPQAGSIMIVDDNPVDRQQVARILQEEGMQAIVLESGPECLDRLPTVRPDALILDLMMPGMDGFTVLNTLRRDPRTRNVPVIILTAKDLEPRERDQLQRDAAAILEKHGLLPSVLLTEVKRVLKRIIVTHPPVAPAQAHLLLVEDSEPAIIQIQQVLEHSGYRVTVARSGQEAIETVQSHLPDGIILDLMMPGMDGFEVLERIRSRPETAHLPVLVLTAKDLTPGDLRRLSANHIQQLIQKGDVDQTQLLFKIQLMLGSTPKQARQPTPRPLESDTPGVVKARQPGWVSLSTPVVESSRHRVCPGISAGNPYLSAPRPLAGMGFSESDTPGVAKARQPGWVSLSTPVVESSRHRVFPGISAGNPYLSGDELHAAPLILVVEDNPDNLTTIRAILQHNYALLTAQNGESGVQQAIAMRPDLILLDLSLPKMDGVEVVARLKRNESTRNIPVIALTAHAMKGDREKTLTAGCDDYLSKPFEPEDLLACVRKYLVFSV